MKSVEPSENIIAQKGIPKTQQLHRLIGLLKKEKETYRKLNNRKDSCESRKDIQEKNVFIREYIPFMFDMLHLRFSKKEEVIQAIIHKYIQAENGYLYDKQCMALERCYWLTDMVEEGFEQMENQYIASLDKEIAVLDGLLQESLSLQKTVMETITLLYDHQLQEVKNPSYLKKEKAARKQLLTILQALAQEANRCPQVEESNAFLKRPIKKT